MDIVLVDFMYLYYKSYFLNSTETSTGNLSGVMRGCLQTLSYLKRTYNCQVIVCMEPCDNSDRKNLYPEYKQNRATRDPKILTAVDDVLGCISKIPGVHLVTSPDSGEGDDIIYSFILKNRDKINNFFVYSLDNDLLQSGIGDLNNRVILCSRTKHNPVDISVGKYCLEKYLVNTDSILIFRSIFGDTSDGIKPAVPRLQKKTVLDVISKCQTLDELYKSLQEASGVNKHAARLLESKQVIDLNFQLMQLKELELRTHTINQLGTYYDYLEKYEVLDLEYLFK